MADRKITIDIATTSNLSGLDAAGKGVEDLGKKTEESGKKTEQSGKSGIGAAKGFAAMGQAAAASSGSVGGLASALGNMAQQIPALAGAAGPIGLAIAAFMSWKKVIDTVRESQESLAKGLRDTAAGNAEAGIKTLANAYSALRDSISDAADAAQSYYDAEGSRDDAQTRAGLAALELEKAQRSAAIDPSDKFGGRRLDLDIANKRAAIEDAAAQRKADRDLNAIRAQAQAAAAAKSAASQQMDDSQASFSDLGGQFSSASDRMRTNIGKAWTPAGREKAANEGQRELARIASAMEAAAAAMRQASSDISQSDRAMASLDSRADAALIDRSTLGTTRKTGTVTRGAAATTYDRDLAAERQRLDEQARAARESQATALQGRAPLTASVRSAQDNLRRARNFGGDDSNVAALKAELDKALAARKQADAAIIANARLQRQQSEQTEKAIKDIEARSRRQ